MSLDKEVARAITKVLTTSYEMSVGEILNLYRDEEIVINPEYQRLFRWKIDQKSKFIESLILGIPIPPIFVFETEDGEWELVDGLQRLSTILEFSGLLREPDSGGLVSPSRLVGTRYLPSLQDAVWEKKKNMDGGGHAIGRALQLSIKRARLGVQILKKASDIRSKYDLFQRLNSGGSILTRQELRNCLAIMSNSEFFHEVKALSNNKDFKEVISQSSEAEQKQVDLEYAMRFIALLFVPYEGDKDLEDYFDDAITKLGEKHDDKAAELYKRTFSETFRLLNSTLGSNALRRYDGSRHAGKVGRRGFEMIALGVAQNLSQVKKWKTNDLRARIEKLWEIPEISTISAAGLRGTDRVKMTVPFGRQWFRRS